MLRKFFEGLAFGCGFSLICVIAIWLTTSLSVPRLLHSGEVTIESSGRESPATGQTHPKFFDLPIEEQIKQANVIALARYESSTDGKRKVVFREILKQDPNATFHYSIGDEYPSASFYPKPDVDMGDGVIVFFVDSPANIKMSISYSGDRIHSLDDISLELFRKKCGAPNA